MLLEALVACAGVTLKAVATAIGIEIASAHVRAEGDLDFRGTLGVDREAPVGFSDIRLSFDVVSDATQEQRDQLLKLTERYCVVLQTLRSAPAVTAGSLPRPDLQRQALDPLDHDRAPSGAPLALWACQRSPSIVT